MGQNFDPKREELNTKVFWMAFETIFIFGIPAFLGAFIGPRLDAMYHTGRMLTVAVLLGTFIFSWVFLIIKYRRIYKEL